MFYDQTPYEIKLEWGQRGAQAASERGDIVIVVDVLSFSSTVVTAVQHKSVIFPYPLPINDNAKAYAREHNAELVWGRAEAIRKGGHSLSPLSFSSADYGRNFVLCSINGAACTWIASQVPALFIGCLLNASAVAEAANQFRQDSKANISVVACGERWPGVLEPDNTLRPAIEDYLGAGLILSKLTGSKSPEAEVCIGAWKHSRDKLSSLIWDSASSRELRERGYDDDVTYCCQVDNSRAVPILQGACFINANAAK